MDSEPMPFGAKRISSLLDVIRNAIIVTDDTNRIIFSNSWTEKMFRAAKNELLGKDIRIVFMPDDREILASNIINITLRDREFESEALMQRLDGSSFPCLMTTSHFSWEDGKEGMAFAVHDLTEVKAIEKSLRRSERIAFLGNLIHDISHQIRNPVMVIGGLARRLESANTSPEIASTIIRETGRLETLLAALDDFIRLPNPKQIKTTFSKIKKMVEEHLNKALDFPDCRLQCLCDEEIADRALMIDTSLLMEALTRITMNSYQAYPSEENEKQILIRFSWSENLNYPYVITIEDQGLGIARDHLPFVFDLFFSNKTSHIGMGLTFAQRVIDLQNGYMTIQSVQEQGTTVSIYLLDERRRSIRTQKLA